MSDRSPCLSCGACCGHFRVSFYWGELLSAGGVVPDDSTEKLGLHRSCMKGTNNAAPCCIELRGVIGEEVFCSIYENRPGPCREFNILLDDGTSNPACERARAAYNLPPLPLIEREPANDEYPLIVEVS